MVIGKENRITVAIRSAIGLEVPFPTATEKSANLISAEVSAECRYYIRPSITQLKNSLNDCENSKVV